MVPTITTGVMTRSMQPSGQAQPDTTTVGTTISRDPVMNEETSARQPAQPPTMATAQQPVAPGQQPGSDPATDVYAGSGRETAVPTRSAASTSEGAGRSDEVNLTAATGGGLAANTTNTEEDEATANASALLTAIHHMKTTMTRLEARVGAMETTRTTPVVQPVATSQMLWHRGHNNQKRRAWRNNECPQRL
ncbi:hypothetical protein GN958_ATG15887 [Phytophthora infestans]|nr:hypothetical protein GN958_ATG15887 [Phytophthora infestans]